MSETEFPLNEIYDKLVEEGGYFNYALIVDVLSRILEGRKEILELCIGTGNIALRLAQKGFLVAGIDQDEKMLGILQEKLESEALDITFIKSSATDFNIEKKFDAIYIHSGHLIFNLSETGLYLNIPDEASMTGTFESVSRCLKIGGLFVINIEKWSDLYIPLDDDGTYYRRTIIEETPKYGTRGHEFYDAKTGKTHREDVDRQPKCTYEKVTEELAKLGFGQFYNHSDMFFVCAFEGRSDFT